MPLSQAEITRVAVVADGPEVFVSWASTAPAGSTYQVYVDHRLAWYGPSLRCRVPGVSSAGGGSLWIDVAVVGASEGPSDFSAGLASLAAGQGRVRLNWLGGTYLDPSGEGDVQGFRIYRSPTPGAAVDLSGPVDVVPAYPGGWVSDGFGLGPFGGGGFGRSATSYTWTAPNLPAGTYRFAIVPYDQTGDERGTGRVVSVLVSPAPSPPGGDGLSTSYTGAPGCQLTLNWPASPTGGGNDRGTSS